MSLKNKKILVTGASGFISSHLVKSLLKEGAKVHAITKYNSVIDNLRLLNYWGDIKVVEADIRNVDSLSQLKKVKPEIIYHLAAYKDSTVSHSPSHRSLLKLSVKWKERESLTSLIFRDLPRIFSIDVTPLENKPQGTIKLK